MKVLIALAVIVGSALAAPSLRIAGGQDASRDEFPYQISMQWGLLGIWSHTCGGSIISEQWIVTAAHCITETPSLGSYRIKAGILNLNDNVASLQTISVASYIVHEAYQGGVNPNDIALLRLSSSLSWSNSVQPINLPSAGAVPTGDSILSGWGSVSTTNVASMPNTLQKATLPLLDLNTCASALVGLFGTSNPLASSNVCTGPLSGGISACSGDSGGPLAQNGQLIGVVSWGVSPCGTFGAPSVYVQTSSFIDWINRNTA
ncbi:polyserase-related [Holotrichia oblita]|uniref:Polyserase-related n=2 Tax=Holotrichia oblita TaxID=644536 RepID=A0ACB9SNQ6_HOLOL|nr:polyserase-related [Holotrichia oblita]KAI4456611.1 polyserase-related [Holotrichia oblita]